MNPDNIKRSILYYPTISIPTDRWLRQALLYWDEVGSIVPRNWDDANLISLGADIDFLANEGEFRPVDPQNLIKRDDGWEKLQDLESELKSIIESRMFKNILQQRKTNLLSHVHKDKVSRGLFYNFLEPQGLAKEDQEDWDWYLVEENTALLYMSLLAKYLADIDIHATVSGTDRAEYQNLIFATCSGNEGFACLDARFKNSLPVPRDDIPLSDILSFKRVRRSELLNFRKLINEFQRSLSGASELREINEVVVDFREALEKGVSDLTSLMEDSKVATIAGSLKTIFNVKSPTLLVTAGVAAGHATKIAEFPIEWAAAGLGIMGLVEVGYHFIDKRNQKRATLRDSAFSYLYHAKAHGLMA